MAGKKGGAGENSKKAAGQARKAEAAANKAAAEDAKKAAAEDADWDRGAKKGNAKKEVAEQKKAEAARKKAERDAMLAEEEKNTPGRSAPKNAKTAVKKTRGIDQAFGQLDGGSGSGPLAALNATGIENAIDALGLVDSSSKVAEIDKHPERRMAKAYKTWRQNNTEREKELQKMGFAYNKREDVLYEEFLKSPDNPMKQVTAKYNTTREELQAIQDEEKRKVEQRLASK